MSGNTVTWKKDQDGALCAYVRDPFGNEKKAAWAPQPGSQVAYLTCPVFEVLYEGTRGPGKTDTLLMDFAQHVGQGFGREWRGIIFRQTYKQLEDIANKTLKWFPMIFPDAKFNSGSYTWRFADGEELLLRYFERPADYWNYHGHAYPFIAWEELTSWATDECYTSMFSCSRSTQVGMPRKYRATTNPYGPGHNWVKRRFQLPQMRGRIIRDSMRMGEVEPPRVAVHGNIYENKILLNAEPDYIQKIMASAKNPAMAEAWLKGRWDITSGGMFDDIWDGSVHAIQPFDFDAIPKGWRIDRSFDWGSSKPFSVGWWAESNGEPIHLPNRKPIGTVRGDVIRIAEWYGWTGQRNEGLRMLATEIAQGIVDRENDWGLAGRVKPGPADTSIFDTENGVNIAEDMGKKGVRWEKADKSPGSRKQGWEVIRKMLRGANPEELGPRENPGLFISTACDQFLETVPSISRSEKDPDDIDTAGEDHIADEARYRLRKKPTVTKQRGF
jgi:hypothetical protein